MSLANTLSITVGGSALTFTRQGGDLSKSTYYYVSSTVRYDLTFRQGFQTLTRSDGSKVKCRRGNVELKTTIFATATVPEIPRLKYDVVVLPLNDTSIVEAKALSDALVAASGALLQQLANGET